jgi:phytoene synthase
VLPAHKRRAIYALYSFCRVVDDCVDQPGGAGEAGLERWLAEARRCYEGGAQTELGRELAEAVERFTIPRACFEEIVAGCRMDLGRVRYDSFEQLRLYCSRVASAVGLACIEVFGYRNPATREYAAELGVALQLTNILRDVASDAARDRLYLPLQDLARFEVSEQELLAAARGGPRAGRLDALLRFQGERAKGRYAQARARLPDADRRAMRSAEVMRAIYRDLLSRLERRGYPLAGPRVRVPGWRKAWLALSAWAGVVPDP